MLIIIVEDLPLPPKPFEKVPEPYRINDRKTKDKRFERHLVSRRFGRVDHECLKDTCKQNN